MQHLTALQTCCARWPYDCQDRWRFALWSCAVAQLLSAAAADSLGRAGGVAAVVHASHRGGARGVLGAAVQRDETVLIAMLGDKRLTCLQLVAQWRLASTPSFAAAREVPSVLDVASSSKDGEKHRSISASCSTRKSVFGGTIMARSLGTSRGPGKAGEQQEVKHAKNSLRFFAQKHYPQMLALLARTALQAQNQREQQVKCLPSSAPIPA